MNNQVDLQSRAIDAIAQVLGVDASTVSLNSSHENVDGWDSLAIINLLMALESEFGVTLEPEDVGQLVSVRQVVQLLIERGVQ